MAKLAWGKPNIEIQLEGTSIWITVPAINEGTTELAAADGEKLEAKDEGGNLIDTKVYASTFTLSFEIFDKQGDPQLIDDVDGVISDNYAIRLTPENTNSAGFFMPRCSVSKQMMFKSKEGIKYKYTFTALKPDTGKMLQEYNASSDNDITAFSFPNIMESAATINSTAHTVAAEVVNGTTVTALVATFALSQGATAKVGVVDQVSGTTANDFTNPVIVIVTAADGTTENWTITVTVA